jgi:hypothetical protein
MMSNTMIRPEIQALIERGNVTLSETELLRCNLDEWVMLIPSFTDESFVANLECILGAQDYRSAVTLYLPELLRRFKSVSMERNRVKDGERTYEREYVLPCFEWAKEVGYDLQQAVYDNPGHNCVELLVKWLIAQRNLHSVEEG